MGGHSESVNIEWTNDFSLEEIYTFAVQCAGCNYCRCYLKELKYPMPLHAHNRDEVFVGRIRRDESQPNTLNMWVVSDNLRKGAATNA